MPVRIKPASAYVAGVCIGLPAFLLLGKAFIWIMATIGTVS
jgi:hypothetical protein